MMSFSWDNIDTVLLDMDGTLLDLAFDNYFWSKLVPLEYAKQHNLSIEQTKEKLLPHFIEIKGTLNWYNIDYWSGYMGFDVAALKMTIQDQAAFLPLADFFLEQLQKMEKRAIIATNADPKAFMIKNQKTQVGSFVEQVISSHDLGFPKEEQEFWELLQTEVGFDSASTLFVDDSPSVLLSAREYGIGTIAAITRPDTTQEGSALNKLEEIEALPQDILRIEGVANLLN